MMVVRIHIVLPHLWLCGFVFNRTEPDFFLFSPKLTLETEVLGEHLEPEGDFKII